MRVDCLCSHTIPAIQAAVGTRAEPAPDSRHSGCRHFNHTPLLTAPRANSCCIRSAHRSIGRAGLSRRPAQVAQRPGHRRQTRLRQPSARCQRLPARPASLANSLSIFTAGLHAACGQHFNRHDAAVQGCHAEMDSGVSTAHHKACECLLLPAWADMPRRDLRIYVGSELTSVCGTEASSRYAWMGCRSDAVCNRPCSARSASRASMSRLRMSRTAGGISRSDSVMPPRISALTEEVCPSGWRWKAGLARARGSGP